LSQPRDSSPPPGRSVRSLMNSVQHYFRAKRAKEIIINKERAQCTSPGWLAEHSLAVHYFIGRLCAWPPPSPPQICCSDPNCDRQSQGPQDPMMDQVAPMILHKSCIMFLHKCLFLAQITMSEFEWSNLVDHPVALFPS
jgi:hypothetical protein